MDEIYENQQNYKLHRLRVLNATSLVNSHAPKPKVNPIEQRELTFIEMMRSLIKQGNQRTFTTSPIRGVQSATDNVNGPKDAALKDLEFMSSKTKSTLTLKTFHKSEQKASKKSYFILKKERTPAIPVHVLKRYDNLKFVNSPELMAKLLRPKIYFNLEVNNMQPLGRLVIQLYTEACPEVVLHFINVCNAKRPSRFKITRLFCHMWLEAELMLDDKNALAIPNIEHDPTAVNHGSSAGILSIPSRYIRGSKYQFINFTISFQPIESLNGKRIAIGIVKRGQHVLDQLQSLKVSRNGKPLDHISVVSCGVF